MRLFRAEMMKLLRPLTLWATVALIGLCGLMAAVYQQSASLNYAGAKAGLADTLAHPASCKQFNLQPGDRCDQLRSQDLALGRDWLDETSRGASLAGATQYPLGAGSLAAGLVASALGAVVVLLIAAAHVAGEWSGGTAKALFLQEGRRWRVVLAKVASVWVAGTWLLLATWAGLAVLGLFLRRMFPLPPPPSISEQWTYAAGHLLRALLVIGAFSTLGVLAGFVVRATAGAFLLATGFVAAWIVLSNFDAFAPYVPASWIAVWMGFTRNPVFMDHLWPDVFSKPSALTGFMGLATLSVLCVALSAWRVRASDVLG